MHNIYLTNSSKSLESFQPAFNCSKLTVEAPEQCGIFVQN